MPPKRFELRVIRAGRQVDTATFVAVLDLRDVIGTPDLLERHIYAVAARDGRGRAEAHLFVLEVRDTNDQGKGHGDLLFRAALPIDPEVR